MDYQIHLLLRGFMSAGWVVPEVKLPVTICGNSIISPEEPTCITLYMTASNAQNKITICIKKT
jgi:hypothetical protein